MLTVVEQALRSAEQDLCPANHCPSPATEDDPLNNGTPLWGTR